MVSKGRQYGFTLLELIVVVLIIGLMTGLVNLSSGLNRQHDIEEEVERIAALITLASEESIFKSTELALEFDTTSYRFLALSDDQWQALEGDRLLRERQLPAGLEIELYIEGERERLFTLATAKEKEKERKPRIYIFSSGELTPFELTLQHADGDKLYTLTGIANGQLEIHRAKRNAS